MGSLCAHRSRVLATSSRRTDRPARRGLVALHELVCVLAITILLISSVSWFMSWILHVPKSAATSRLWVSRIWIDDKHGLYVYRAHEGIFRRDLFGGEWTQVIPFRPVEQTSVAVSKSGSTVLTCAPDGQVVIYRDGEEALVDQIARDDEVVATLVSHDGDCASCVLSTGSVFGWQYSGSRWSPFQYELPGSLILSVTLNELANRLMVARVDGQISFHDLITGQAAGTSIGVGTECIAVECSRDESRIVTLLRSGRVRIFDAVTGHVLQEAVLIDQPSCRHFGTVKVSPDGEWIAATLVGCVEIFVWNINSGKPAGKLLGHTALPRSLQFSPESDRLYSGSYDGTVREWSLESLSQLRTVE